jgi:hypothetical protein
MTVTVVVYNPQGVVIGEQVIAWERLLYFIYEQLELGLSVMVSP